MLTDAQQRRIDMLPLAHLERDKLYCQMMEAFILMPSPQDKGFFKWIKRRLTNREKSHYNN